MSADESGNPSWLTVDSNGYLPANESTRKVVTNAAVTEIAKNYASETTSVIPGLEITPEELSSIRKWNIGLRILGCCSCCVVAAAAVLNLNTGDLSTTFIACYAFFFAVLSFFFELSLPGISTLIAGNFGFMYSVFGRTFFMMFLAGLCYRLGTIGIGAMASICLCWALYLIIRVRHPLFGDYLRASHFNKKPPRNEKGSVDPPKKRFGIF